MDGRQAGLLTHCFCVCATHRQSAAMLHAQMTMVRRGARGVAERLRKHIARMCEEYAARHGPLACKLVTAEHNFDAHLGLATQVMQQSRFCLEPPGFGDERKAIVDGAKYNDGRRDEMLAKVKAKYSMLSAGCAPPRIAPSAQRPRSAPQIAE